MDVRKNKTIENILYQKRRSNHWNERTTVATIHQHSDTDTLGDTFDQVFVQVVVDDLSGTFEVDRDQCFVVPVIFIAAFVNDTASVARVMDEHNIPSFGILSDPVECIHDVLFGGLMVVTIIHQDQHILLLETLVLHQVGLDVLYVVMAATQLTLLADIIDTNKYGPSGSDSDRTFWNDLEFVIHIK